MTDHPVLRLNYYRQDHYDFKGGWGKQGCDIFMPISPRHLLHTQVGYRTVPNHFVFCKEKTTIVQRMLLERAHRWIFATSQQPWVEQTRPRTVNSDAYESEERMWSKWHAQIFDGADPEDEPSATDR